MKKTPRLAALLLLCACASPAPAPLTHAAAPSGSPSVPAAHAPHEQGDAAATTPLPRLATAEDLHARGIPRLDGAVPTYHSAGHEARARELAGMMGGFARFYNAAFGVRIPVRLAVLAEDDWAAATQVPFGFPHFNGMLAFLPTRQDGIVSADLIPRLADASARSLADVRASGLTWDEASLRMVDMVGFHELGHGYVRELGIEPHRHWFSELLATYFGYAYMRQAHPRLALAWDGVLRAVTDGPAPRYTSFADFERLYVRVGVPNYHWYQATFQRRVAEVYERQGVGFLHRVREAFPADEGMKLTTDQVLERLERIEPGFLAWARELDRTR